MSRNKGKVYEREVAAEFTSRGHEARRGRQYAGHPDAPDVVVLDSPWLHLEAKRREKVAIRKWMDQAVEDASDVQIPVVFHRRSREETLVTMRMEDWFRFFARYVA